MQVGVHLPYERLAWMSALAVALALIAGQSVRVIRRGQHLAQSNAALTQANEDLRVEAAIERVQTQAFAMEASDDLASVSDVVFRECVGMGYPLRSVVLTAIDDDGVVQMRIHKPGDVESSLTMHGAEAWGPHPFFDVAKAALERGDSHCSYVWEQDDYEKFWHINIEAGLDPASDLPSDPDRPGLPAMTEGVVTHTIFHARGSLAFWASEALTETDLAVGKRFADAFAFAYDRFLELRAKETQNRELQIQGALERVRSQALGMQTSEDIRGVSEALFSEFAGLGYSAWRTSIVILNRDEDYY